MEITKDMLIADLLQVGNSQEVAQTLLSIGMHCLGCAMAHGETIEQAAMAHNVDVDELVKMLKNAASK